MQKGQIHQMVFIIFSDCEEKYFRTRTHEQRANKKKNGRKELFLPAQ